MSGQEAVASSDTTQDKIRDSKEGTGKVAKKALVMGWVCVLVACIVNFVPSFAQAQLAPLAANIMQAFDISQAQYVNVFTAPNMMPIFLSFVAGLLLDRLGSKKVILVAASLTALGCIGRVVAPGFVPFYISNALLGVTASFVITGATKILSQYFPVEKLSFPVGLLYAFASIGTLIGTATAAMFSSETVAFIVAAVIAVAAALLWAFVVPSEKSSADAGKQTESAQGPKIGDLLKVVLADWHVWVIAMCLLCMSVLGFTIQAELPTALAERGMDSVSAGLMSSVFAVGMLCGSLIVPALADRLGKQKVMLVIMLIVLALLCPCIMLAPMGAMLGVVLFLLGFIIFGAVPMMISIPIRLPEIGVAYAATAGGVIMTVGSAGVFLLPGNVLVPLSGGSFLVLFAILGGLALVAFIGILLIRIPQVAGGAQD